MIPILAGTFVALMVIGVPIAFAIGASAILALVISGQYPLEIVVQRLYAGGNNFTLLAIPLFVLAGELMSATGLTRGLVSFAHALVGHLRGGQSVTTILANTIFAGLTGSGVADAVAIGSVMIPSLKARGYPNGMAAAIHCAGGTIGPIIPPSLSMIIYASLADLSVGKLFLAGIFPGLLMGIGFMVIAYVMNLRGGWEGSGVRAPVTEVLRVTLQSLPALVMPFLILGGIVSGVFTATEAGIAAVDYAILVGILTRRLTFTTFARAFIRTAQITTLALFVISMASIFSWVLAIEQVPTNTIHFLSGLSVGNPIVLGVLVVAFLIVIGFFVETLSALIIFIPVLAPLAPVIGLDPIHWALLMVLATNMGGITPPVGTMLFVIGSMTGSSVGEISRYIWPFVAWSIAVIAIVMLAAPATMFLPNLFFP